jgi:pimeloyl-ACP methyl ester carboxylesterase
MFLTPRIWEGWIARLGRKGYEISAPAWPLHDGPVAELRNPARFDRLGQLELADVVDAYRQLLRKKSIKPILIGHSMGGLVAQILLAEGLAQGAVVIDSAPPHRVGTYKWEALRANWAIVNPFANSSRPVEKDQADFDYGFANEQPPEARVQAFREQVVPDSRRVGLGIFDKPGDVARDRARGPLLLMAGGSDHTIPASLTYDNFRYYANTPGYSEFMLFPDRDHWLIAGKDWEGVADAAQDWIAARF